MEAAPDGRGWKFLHVEPNPHNEDGFDGMRYRDLLMFDDPEKLARRVGDDGRLRE
jgi:hypothetical protein